MTITSLAFTDTRALIKHSVRYAKGKALDLGAGTAKYKELIAPACSSYVASDAFAGPHIDVVADIEQLPFADGSFDTLYCTQVLEHIPRPWKAAEEVKRL